MAVAFAHRVERYRVFACGANDPRGNDVVRLWCGEGDRVRLGHIALRWLRAGGGERTHKDKEQSAHHEP
jgi:hypothetical protein